MDLYACESEEQVATIGSDCHLLRLRLLLLWLHWLRLHRLRLHWLRLTQVATIGSDCRLLWLQLLLLRLLWLRLLWSRLENILCASCELLCAETSGLITSKNRHLHLADLCYHRCVWPFVVGHIEPDELCHVSCLLVHSNLHLIIDKERWQGRFCKSNHKDYFFFRCKRALSNLINLEINLNYIRWTFLHFLTLPSWRQRIRYSKVRRVSVIFLKHWRFVAPRDIIRV